MAPEPALKAGAEAFLGHLTERARERDVPIEATRWQSGTRADSVELTVVSRRKAYIFSLPATDLTDPHAGALRQEILERLLTTIKDNLVRGRIRGPAHRHRATG